MSAPLYVSSYSSSTEIQFINNLTSPPTVLHISKPIGEISVSRSAYFYFIFDCTSFHSSILTSNCTPVDGETDKFATFGQSLPGILGIVRLRFGKYVIVITKAEKIGLIKGHAIYQIIDFEFIALQDGVVRDKDEAAYLALLKRGVKAGPMYFSYTWDLSNSMQRQSSSTDSPVWMKADDRFFWNKFAISPLIEFADSDPEVSHFILPVIFGYVNLTKTSLKSTAFTFGLISRRSRFRAGTRYFSRGIDAQGNVSNYNETEQLVILDETAQYTTYSFVQTRGSVPVYWAEINNLRYKPKLRVFDTALESAKLHFETQKKYYGRNYCVNLVNQAGYEMPVKSAFETAITNLNDPDVLYIYFDFHHECKGMKWYRVQLLIDKLIGLGAGDMGWFQSVESPEKSTTIVQKTQNGVVRTNCMDCLDRTNVVQSTLAGWTLQRQLIDARILAPAERWEEDAAFVSVFRNMWADNADFISKAYSGTGALKTDFTRTGKRTKQGALQDLRNSIERYAKNNFFDGPRQDAYDLFLGNHLPYEVAEPPFRDHRPLLIQSMPYVVYGAIMMIMAAIFLPRANDARLSIRLFILIWLLVLSYAMWFIAGHGLAYVNWPRLVQLDYVGEQEVVHAGTGKIKGWVMSEKTKLESRIRGLEEGKKRTE
ncbi:putative phosphoinositide phosphatase [Myxozyma melibiosi]|uniref:Phosphoinositide phosphatase n=1 Tax=Myxozyma melibiosi TaxID=54550 RepID=A0ABR1F0Q6_9ASCO